MILSILQSWTLSQVTTPLCPCSVMCCLTFFRFWSHKAYSTKFWDGYHLSCMSACLFSWCCCFQYKERVEVMVSIDEKRRSLLKLQGWIGEDGRLVFESFWIFCWCFWQSRNFRMEVLSSLYLLYWIEWRFICRKRNSSIFIYSSSALDKVFNSYAQQSARDIYMDNYHSLNESAIKYFSQCRWWHMIKVEENGEYPTLMYKLNYSFP